jgi:uncharacterized protein with GYD domain
MMGVVRAETHLIASAGGGRGPSEIGAEAGIPGPNFFAVRLTSRPCPEAKGNAMPTYITLNNFTHQGITNVKDTTKRADAYKTLAKQFGCTVREIYWTQGQYDVVTIVDAPDDASATALAMSAGKLGNVRTQTLRAFTAAELAPILDKVS